MKKIIVFSLVFFYALCSFSCLLYPYKKDIPTAKIAEKTDRTVTLHFCCDVTDKVGFDSVVISDEDTIDELYPNGKLNEDLRVRDLQKYIIRSNYDVFLGSTIKKTIYGCYKFEASKLTGTVDKKFAFIGAKTFGANVQTTYYSVYGLSLSLKPGEYYYMLKYASSNSASGFEVIEITQADFVKNIEPRILGYGIPKSDSIEGWVYSE